MSFTIRHNLRRRLLRRYVGPSGALTPLGVLVDNRTLHTPEDRWREGLPPVDQKNVLALKDFRNARNLIGTAVGKISRQQFSELFGFDIATIRQYFRPDGRLTPAGKLAMARAVAVASGPAPLAPPQPGGVPPSANMAASLTSVTDATGAPRSAPAGPDTATRAARMSTAEVEQRVWAFCMQNHIAVEFQIGSYARHMGMPRSPYAGELRMRGDAWIVHPEEGGHYLIAAGEDGLNRAMEVLRLRPSDATVLERDYALSRPDAYGVVTLTPKASTAPIPPA
jgi:hypothetical protein